MSVTLEIRFKMKYVIKILNSIIMNVVVTKKGIIK